MPLAGTLIFEIAGKTHRLQAARDTETDDLFVLFRDTTNGRETYGAGRFLHAANPMPPAGPPWISTGPTTHLAPSLPLPPVRRHRLKIGFRSQFWRESASTEEPWIPIGPCADMAKMSQDCHN